MHVSTAGDGRVAASYSTVVGQIHSGEGHENEPCKIFYKKFPGQEKGSVFWNYEINTAGDDNTGRWDYSYPVWGYDMSVVGSSPTAVGPWLQIFMGSGSAGEPWRFCTAALSHSCSSGTRLTTQALTTPSGIPISIPLDSLARPCNTPMEPFGSDLIPLVRVGLLTPRTKPSQQT